MTKRFFCLLGWVVSFALIAAFGGRVGPAHCAEPELIPATLKIVSLEAHPTSVELRHRFDYRQVLLLGRTDGGELVDLTRAAQLGQSSRIVQVSPTGLVTAVADGDETLTYRYGERTLAVPVKVANSGHAVDVSFLRDVQPILSKTGCNSGTCHGSREGKYGFKLSLRGYDALFDHRALTDDISARRFNRAAPDQSLMLLKASGSIPHVGGVRMEVNHPYYEILRQWVAGGVKLDLAAVRVAKIEVLPKDPIIPLPGMKQQMSVLATFADGATRDVTREAFIESGNIEILEANPQGIVTTLRRGEAPVLVRYDGAYAATTVIVMGDRSEFVWQTPPTNNYIDELVYKKLARVKILPSDLSTDVEFVRRLYLDLTGLPPTAADVRAFVADPRDSRVKRDELIDRLVGSPPYVEHWTNKWADLLQVNRKFLGEEGALALRNWIKQAVATNRPYDQIAREIVTASGSNIANPPAAYYKVLRAPQEAMENTTHLFLAVRFNCNKCHDHPFERWTQDQYYQLSAFFAQIGRKEDPVFVGQRIGGSAVEGAAPLVEVVYDTGGGEVKHDRTGQLTPPSFPYQRDITTDAHTSRRQQLADWLVSKDNQYFGRSYVNRLWGYLFGHGIIEPIDDIRAGNPPTNPELLDALTRDFVEHGFDMQHMLRTICRSRVYQHSVRTNTWNADDEINHSHALPRRLPAEVLFDAIHFASGSIPRIPGAPNGFRAAELPDAGVSLPFLEDFGRPVRESACECERSSGMVLGPVMKLINGPTVADAIADPANELTKLAASPIDDRQLINELFLRFLSRPATIEELALGLEAIAQAGSEHERSLAALRAYEAQLPAKQAAWEQSAGQPTVWKTLDPSEMKSAVGATFAKRDDGSIFATGNTGKDVYTIVTPLDPLGVTGLRLEVLADPALPVGGPGRAMNGNLVLSELKISAAAKNSPTQPQAATLQNAQATFSQEGWAVAGAIDGNEATGWAVSPQFNKNHTATFEVQGLAEFRPAEGGLMTLTLSQQYPDGQHLLGRFRLSVTSSPLPWDKSKLPADVAAALAVAKDQRNDPQKAVLTNYVKSLDGEYQRRVQVAQQTAEQAKNRRLFGAQDVAWAIINNPAFLFNH